MIKKYTFVFFTFLSLQSFIINCHNASFFDWHIQIQQSIQNEIESLEQEMIEFNNFIFPKTKYSDKNQNIIINAYQDNTTNKIGIEINIPGSFVPEEINIKITDQGILKIVAEKIDSSQKTDKTYFYRETKYKQKKCFIRNINLKNFKQLKDLNFDNFNTKTIMQNHQIIKDKHGNKQTQVTIEFDNPSLAKNASPSENKNIKTTKNLPEKNQIEVLDKKNDSKKLETDLEIKLK